MASWEVQLGFYSFNLCSGFALPIALLLDGKALHIATLSTCRFVRVSPYLCLFPSHCTPLRLSFHPLDSAPSPPLTPLPVHEASAKIARVAWRSFFFAALHNSFALQKFLSILGLLPSKHGMKATHCTDCGLWWWDWREFRVILEWWKHGLGSHLDEVCFDLKQ